MASQKQIDANRRNARRSTGPKTPAGKAISSRNALKHGLRAPAAVLLGEDKPAFERLFKAFRAEYRPIGRLEEFLVEQMALACWKLSRVTRAEPHIFQYKSTPDNLFSDLRKACLGTENEPDSKPNEPNLSPDQLIARAFLRDTSGFNTFTRLSHYEMRLERSFYHALRELERLRAKRAPSQPTP